MGKSRFDKNFHKHEQVEVLIEGEEKSKCVPKGNEKVLINVEIPVIDSFDTSIELDVHPDELLLIDSFTPSVVGKIFKISYELIVQV